MHWNDPDMLEVGNHGLSHEEERSHFALWAFAKAPLIIGCDLNTVTDESLSILRNKNLIAINQDPLGKQAACVQGCGSSQIEVFGAKQAHDGGFFGLVAVNWDDYDSHPLSIDFVKIGAATSDDQICEVYDIWTGGHIGDYHGKYFVPELIEPHDNVALKIKCTSSISTSVKQSL